MTASNPSLRGHVSDAGESGQGEEGAHLDECARKLLSSPGKHRVEVNVGRISRVAPRTAQAIFVPGKVLGTGAHGQEARRRRILILGRPRGRRSRRAGAPPFQSKQFLKKYPKGSGVKLVK